jgi:transposase
MSAIKKTLFHPKSDPVERIYFQTRIEWYEKIEQRHVVYLDESGFAVDAPRTHGYTTKGMRCYDKKDWHAKGRLNAIGAILNFQFLAVNLWNCNVNSTVFYTWITQALLPRTPQHSVIVMDGASFHKRADILKAIESQGHVVQFLPPYSPDLNPIEKKWSQAKAIRRRERCTPYQLFSDYTL